MEKDYVKCYRVLRIPPDSPFDLVKKAYRQYVHLYHPDVCSNNKIYVERFKEIQDAYQTLRDLSFRSRYIPQNKTIQSRSIEPEKLIPEKKEFVYTSKNNFSFKVNKFTAVKNNNMEIDLISRNLPTKSLIERLTSSDNKYVRMAAAKALYPRKSPKNLLFLLSACNDKDVDVSDFIVGLLRNYFDFEGLTYLKKIWQISSQSQKFKLLLVFEKINDPRIASVIQDDSLKHSNFLKRKMDRFFKKLGNMKFTIFQ